MATFVQKYKKNLVESRKKRNFAPQFARGCKNATL